MRSGLAGGGKRIVEAVTAGPAYAGAAVPLREVSGAPHPRFDHPMFDHVARLIGKGLRGARNTRHIGEPSVLVEALGPARGGGRNRERLGRN